jgi:hypothetical protein
MAAESDQERLPFEPKGNKRKKPDKKAPSSPAKKSSVAPQRSSSPGRKPRAIDPTPKFPEVVSQRMLKRMLAFLRHSHGLGVAVFFISYLLIVRQIVDLPNVAVLLTSMGCFGLGVVGLSYGALSTSWDEMRPGSLLGMDEFQVNFGRLTGAWRDTRENRRQTKSDS